MFYRFVKQETLLCPRFRFHLLFGCCHIAPQGIADVHSEPPFLLRGGCGFCRTLPGFAEGMEVSTVFSDGAKDFLPTQLLCQ